MPTIVSIRDSIYVRKAILRADMSDIMYFVGGFKYVQVLYPPKL